ncbi:MAG TPA: hypothetical protein VK988_13760 [Acidimicrobiales bacterium]|nr:hypothetical protein [Acidimicrobiales bacterium]
MARWHRLSPWLVVVAAVAVLALALPTALAAGTAGDLDPDFDADGKVTTDIVGQNDDRIAALAIQSDGKSVVAGTVAQEFGGPVFALARYNTNGSLDATFDGDGKVTTPVRSDNPTDGDPTLTAMAIQPDGKIVVAGSRGGSRTAAPNFDIILARYNTNGSLDTSFDLDGRVTTDLGLDETATGLGVQVLGGVTRLVVVGASAEPTLGRQDFLLVRYNLNGTLDPTFGSGGAVRTNFGPTRAQAARANALVIQDNGAIVAAGSTGGDFALARYNADGGLDTAFDGDGKVTTDFENVDAAFALAIQAEANSFKIVAAGTGKDGGDFALARYNPDGGLDPSFDGDGKLTTDLGSSRDQANGLVVQPDGKLVAAGGNALGGASAADFALARYNPDGGLDPSFDGDGKVTTDFFGRGDVLRALAIQPDGKLVAAGEANSVGPSFDRTDFALARYLGSSDTSGPTVSSTSPSSLPQGSAAQNVTISGTNFASGATASFSGTGVSVNSTTFQNTTTVVANVTVASDAPGGARNVTVTNPGGASGSCSGCFTVTASSGGSSAGSNTDSSGAGGPTAAVMSQPEGPSSGAGRSARSGAGQPGGSGGSQRGARGTLAKTGVNLTALLSLSGVSIWLGVCLVQESRKPRRTPRAGGRP